jgi:hypothetical protein
MPSSHLKPQKSISRCISDACRPAAFPRIRRNFVRSAITIDGLTTPPVTCLEVANTDGRFNAVQSYNSLHRANKSRVVHQDRREVIAAHKRPPRICCRHMPPPLDLLFRFCFTLRHMRTKACALPFLLFVGWEQKRLIFRELSQQK